MIGGRALRIGGAALRLALVGASERPRAVPSERSHLPRELRLTLDRLGPAFVKAGQGLSLREDILPPAYVQDLANLNDKVSSKFNQAISGMTMSLSAGEPAGRQALLECLVQKRSRREARPLRHG
jgi:ubiquinone biosynthesis protein